MPAALKGNDVAAPCETKLRPGDTEARLALEATRWRHGPKCPHCRESTAIERLGTACDGDGLLLCGTCRAQFSVVTGTAMQHSKVPLHKWIQAMQQLGTANPAARLTRLFPGLGRDPDLRLLADGRVLRPDTVHDAVFSFAVPGRPRELRLLSRSIIPAQHDATQTDLRRLGVDVSLFLVSDAAAQTRWPYHHRALAYGFHPAEDGHRWTDGNALLPAEFYAACRDGFTLEVHLNSQTLHYV